MRKEVVILLFFANCAFGQLYPLADTATVRKGLDGSKDVRLRLFKIGSDPLKDMSLKTLFGEINKKITGATNQTLSRPLVGTLRLTKTGASDFVSLPDSSDTNELQTISGGSNSITLSQGGGTVTVDTSPDNGTVSSVAATAPAAGFTISGSPITTSGTLLFALANDLAAIEGIAGTGMAVRTATDTWTVRTITGTASQITATNGNGVSGNPTLSLTNTGVTAGSYGSTTAVGMFTVDAQGRLTSANNTSIAFPDNSASNEGSLSVLAGTGSTSILTSNTTGSTNVTFIAGGGMNISETASSITISNAASDQIVTLTPTGIVNIGGTYPNFTVGAVEVDGSITNEIQTLSRPTAGTLKLTTNAASNFVTLPDSTVSNEGLLTVGVGAANSSTITSNTSGSNTVEIEGGTGVTVTEVGSKITVSATNNGTVTSVAATAPASGFTITGSAITSSGTLTFALNNDLAALEALGTTGYVARTASNTYATRTMTSPLGTISLTHPAGIASGTTFDLAYTGVSSGTYGSAILIPNFTVDLFGRLTVAGNNFLPSQIISKPYSNTIKLTNYYGASNFVTCSPDSTNNNEGMLTVTSGGANTSVITSNTFGGLPVTLIAAGGITSSLMGNQITLTGGSGLKHLKHSTANIGRGLFTTINIPKDTATVEFRYSAMKTETFIDTLDQVLFYDSSAVTNSKQQKKFFNYNAFKDIKQSSNSTQVLVANTNTDLKLTDEGLGLLFTYSTSTGELKYNGTIPKMFVISGKVTYKYSLIGTNQELDLMLKPAGGAFAEIATDKMNTSSTTQGYSLGVMRIYNLSQGDVLKLQIRSDAGGTWTTNTGYFNVFALSDNYNPN